MTWLLPLLRTPTDEPGRRWSYHRLLWLGGWFLVVAVWRGAPYAAQHGALLFTVGAVLAVVGRHGLGLYLCAVGVALLL